MHATAMPTRTEVAIVGAGPTGLALAVTLASAGIDYVIVDRLAAKPSVKRAVLRGKARRSRPRAPERRAERRRTVREEPG